MINEPEMKMTTSKVVLLTVSSFQVVAACGVAQKRPCISALLPLLNRKTSTAVAFREQRSARTLAWLRCRLALFQANLPLSAGERLPRSSAV